MLKLDEIKFIESLLVIISEKFCQVCITGAVCDGRIGFRLADGTFSAQFAFDDFGSNASAIGERGHSNDHRIELAEVAAPGGVWCERVEEEEVARFLVE